MDQHSLKAWRREKQRWLNDPGEFDLSLDLLDQVRLNGTLTHPFMAEFRLIMDLTCNPRLSEFNPIPG